VPFPDEGEQSEWYHPVALATKEMCRMTNRAPYLPGAFQGIEIGPAGSASFVLDLEFTKSRVLILTYCDVTLA
jgi:hypothetical protein